MKLTKEEKENYAELFVLSQMTDHGAKLNYDLKEPDDYLLKDIIERLAFKRNLRTKDLGIEIQSGLYPTKPPPPPRPPKPPVTRLLYR